MMPSPKIAVVSDWLVTNGGDIRVLEQILKAFPEADLYTTLDYLPEQYRAFLKNKSVTVSFIQKLPMVRKFYWYYIFLMPFAIEQFDLSTYDIIISSHNAVANGVLVAPDQLHISYTHSPMRFSWDLQEYYLRLFSHKSKIKNLIARLIFHYLRIWDSRTINSVDILIANSYFISRRIEKVYRREAVVIYPCVNVDIFTYQEEKENFYLTAGFMNPFKRIDLVVEAFANMKSHNLVVIGAGPDYQKIKQKANLNIEFLGYQELDVLKSYMQRAKAFVYAAPEDFGIIMCEAQSCGTPVIAYRKGGASEIVRDLDTENPTGILYAEQTIQCLTEAIQLFEVNHQRIKPSDCRENVMRFSPDIFREELTEIVYCGWKNLKKKNNIQY